MPEDEADVAAPLLAVLVLDAVVAVGDAEDSGVVAVPLEPPAVGVGVEAGVLLVVVCDPPEPL